MTSSVGRYTKYYLNQMRPDLAGYFPKNVFLRNQNYQCKFENLINKVSR